MPAIVKKCRHSREQWGDCACQWYADYRVGGERTYKPLGRDRSQAEASYRLVLAELAAGIRGVTPGVTFGELSAAFVTSCKHRNMRPQSIERYRSILRHPERYFAGGPASAIGTPELAAFAGSLLDAGHSRSHTRMILNLTVAAIRHGAEMGLVDSVPTRPSVLGKSIDDTPEIEVMELDVALSVIAVLREPERSMSIFTLWTGLRASEMLALTPGSVGSGCVNISRTQVQSRKTEAGRVATNRPKSSRGKRTVDLIPDAVEALRRLDLPADSTYSRWLGRWQRGCKKARVPATGLHALRHTNVSLRFAAGQTLTYIADQLGDAPQTITRHYAHLLRAQTPPQTDLLAAVAEGRPPVRK